MRVSVCLYVCVAASVKNTVIEPTPQRCREITAAA